MDELNLLARRQAKIPEPPPAVVQEARQQLLDRMAVASVIPLRRRISTRTGLSVAAAVAVLATGATVAVTVTGNHHSARPVADPGHQVAGAALRPTNTRPVISAAVLLNTAAAQTLRNGDPKPAASQFTKVSTHSWEAITVQGSASPTAATTTFLRENLTEEWAPANPRATWYFRMTDTIATRFFSADDQAYVRQNYPRELKRTVGTSSGKDGQATQYLVDGQPSGPPSAAVPATWGGSDARFPGRPTP